jgi:hypothetical protein
MASYEIMKSFLMSVQILYSSQISPLGALHPAVTAGGGGGAGASVPGVFSKFPYN